MVFLRFVILIYTITQLSQVREVKEVQGVQGVKDVCLDYENSKNDGEILLSLTPLNFFNSLNSTKLSTCET